MNQLQVFDSNVHEEFFNFDFEFDEEGFCWINDRVFVHYLEVNTMAPWIPAGSLLIVDSSQRWPIEGELFLVRWGHGKLKYSPQLFRAYWMYKNGSISVGLVDEYPSRSKRKRLYPIQPEQLEKRQIEWILGRVRGVMVSYR